MTSKRVVEPVDFERDLPTTPEDVAKLRELKARSVPDFATYIEILSEMDLSWIPARRRKPLRCPEPFEL